LWKLVYREAGMARDVVVSAGDVERAERVGRAWCAGEPGRVYVGVSRFVVAGEEVVGGGG
jgi:hypothetical protein